MTSLLISAVLLGKGQKLPDFAYTMEFSIAEVFVNERVLQKDLPRRLRGAFPKFTSGDVIQLKTDPGRDITCGSQMSQALISKAASQSEVGSGRIEYRFDPYSDFSKTVKTDARNRVISWSLFFWDDDGAEFKHMYRNVSAIFGRPYSAGRQEDGVRGVWVFSEGAQIQVRWGRGDDGKQRTWMGYYVE